MQPVWSYYIVVRAHLQAKDAVELVVVPADHDDRNLRAEPDDLAQFESIDVWQLKLEQHDIHLTKVVESRPPPADRYSPNSFPMQRARQFISTIHIVFHEQDLHRFTPSGISYMLGTLIRILLRVVKQGVRFRA
jgi:hypothetical protein